MPAGRSARDFYRSEEWIDDFYAGLLEIVPVPGGDRNPVDKGSCCDQAVFDRHRLAAPPKIGEKLSPAQSSGRIPGETMDALDTVLKPPLQPVAALARREQQNAEADLSDDDRIDGDLPFMAGQPLQNPRLRIGLGGLAQDVGVNQDGHRVSVDSDSIGTK